MSEWHEAEDRIEKARFFFEQQRWHEALDELRAAIAQDPYNANWLFNVGLTLDELSRYEEAIEAYRRSLEIEPGDVQAMNHLGIDLCRLGKYRQAIRQFQRIEQLDPAFEPAYCHRILAYAELGDHESAEQMFYLARLYKEQCPSCFYNMGCSLAARGLTDKAIYCWQRTLELDETHPEVHLRLAEVLRDRGRLESSRRYYLQALRQNPQSVQTLLDLADLLIEMNRFDEAGGKIRRALEIAPDQPAGYLYQGMWLMAAGQSDEAIKAYNRALSLDNRLPGVHLRLAEAYRAKNDLHRMQWHLRQELLLRPVDSSLLLKVGNQLLDCHDYRTAIACFKRMASVDPENAAAWQNLAVAQFAAGRDIDGITSCQQALGREPRNVSACFNLALAYERQGNHQKALVCAYKAQTLAPADRGITELIFRIRVLRAIALVRGLLRFPISRPA